jgi:hypothetical protein
LSRTLAAHAYVRGKAREEAVEAFVTEFAVDDDVTMIGIN